MLLDIFNKVYIGSNSTKIDTHSFINIHQIKYNFMESVHCKEYVDILVK